MTAGKFGSQKRVKYRCAAMANSGAHKGGYIMGWIVEEAVMAWIRDMAGSVDQAIDLALAASQRRSTEAEQIARLQTEVERLDEQLVRLTRQMVGGLVPDDAYASARDQIQAEQLQAQDRIAALRDSLALSRQVKPQEMAADLLQHWDLRTVSEQRQFLRRLIDRVIVTQKDGHRSVEIIPAGR